MILILISNHFTSDLSQHCLQHYGIYLLYNLEWYNVISRFTAELVAEIDEIEALVDAPVRNNNNWAQNGTY